MTNTSVNPARSTGPDLLVGGQLFGQPWLFWVAPILGAVLAGWVYSIEDLSFNLATVVAVGWALPTLGETLFQKLPGYIAVCLIGGYYPPIFLFFRVGR